ncbi:hypothetical protein D9757_010071 [Collybiopsis confluens]|uniref:Uncharacterized protein n=1 Tax=Collybiopsis confluens TaxID=2823264 RepID=A0A8H5LYC1_9AGAR|nr:hypothetical protein D9757_010071 [Collybiopsis confluens]
MMVALSSSKPGSGIGDSGAGVFRICPGASFLPAVPPFPSHVSSVFILALGTPTPFKDLTGENKLSGTDVIKDFAASRHTLLARCSVMLYHDCPRGGKGGRKPTSSRIAIVASPAIIAPELLVMWAARQW